MTSIPPRDLLLPLNCVYSFSPGHLCRVFFFRLSRKEIALTLLRPPHLTCLHSPFFLWSFLRQLSAICSNSRRSSRNLVARLHSRAHCCRLLTENCSFLSLPHFVRRDLRHEHLCPPPAGLCEPSPTWRTTVLHHWSVSIQPTPSISCW